MRKAHFAGFRNLAAPYQAGIRNSMVGGPEGAGSYEAAPLGHEAHDAVDLGGLQGLLESWFRQNRVESPREHGLSSARRTYHDHVVPARGRYLHGPLHVLLSTYIAEIHLMIGSIKELVEIHLERTYL